MRGRRMRWTVMFGVVAIAAPVLAVVASVPDELAGAAVSEYTVPDDVCAVTIAATGATGGSGGPNGSALPVPGAGGFAGESITATFAVTPGETLTVTTGDAGPDGNPGAGGGGGASGGTPTVGIGGPGGAGGGGGNGGAAVGNGGPGGPGGTGGDGGPGGDSSETVGGTGGSGAAGGHGGGSGGGGGGASTVTSGATTLLSAAGGAGGNGGGGTGTADGEAGADGLPGGSPGDPGEPGEPSFDANGGAGGDGGDGADGGGDDGGNGGAGGAGGHAGFSGTGGSSGSGGDGGDGAASGGAGGAGASGGDGGGGLGGLALGATVADPSATDVMDGEGPGPDGASNGQVTITPAGTCPETPTTSPTPAPTATGTVSAPCGPVTTTVSRGSLVDLASVPIPATPAPPAGIGFPCELLGFRITGLDNGASSTVTVALPVAATSYWKLQNGAWFEVPLALNGNQAQFTLTDGGFGDADGTANGTIVDPGGPTNAAPTSVAVAAQPQFTG